MVGSGRSSLSLILCNIDYFESYVDTYGYSSGDVCLKKVARSIQDSVKGVSTDLVAIYRGHTFGIILPNTIALGMEQTISAIQRGIKSIAIPHSASEVSAHITLSFGGAAVDFIDNRQPEILIETAGESLRLAKKEGRDRFCIAHVE